MNYLKYCMNWMLKFKHLKDYNYKKNYLIYSNIFFFIFAFLIFRNKKNFNNNQIKHSISILFILTMGVISTKYHNCQCHNDSNELVGKWQSIDVYTALGLNVILLTLYYKNININIFLWWVLTMFIFISTTIDNDVYVIFHSLWHFMTSVYMYLLIIND